MGVEPQKGGMKLFFTVPNAFTLLNLISGFISIYLAALSEYLLSFMFIVIAIVFDGLDGFVARMLNAASDFGRELDSLCDEVSFGVAPAFLLVKITLDRNPELIVYAVIVGAIFAAFGALRLARFNLFGSKEFFEGLAIPGAAFFAGLAITCVYTLNPIISIVLILATAFLMISPISFPSTKTRIGIRSVCISLVVGLVYFGIWILVMLFPFDWLSYMLWLLFFMMLSYITVAPIVFRRMLRSS